MKIFLIDSEGVFDPARYGFAGFEFYRAGGRDGFFRESVRQSFDRRYRTDPAGREERDSQDDLTLNVLLTCFVGIRRFRLRDDPERLCRRSLRSRRCATAAGAPTTRPIAGTVTVTATRTGAPQSTRAFARALSGP